jgi:hypothetical protein
MSFTRLCKQILVRILVSPPVALKAERNKPNMTLKENQRGTIF